MNPQRAEMRLLRLRQHIDESDDLRDKTQDIIAEALGLPNGSYLSRLFHGRKRLGEDTARAIERRRGLAEHWLDGDRDANRIAQSILEELPISPQAADIGRKWASLDEPARTQVSDLLDTLTEQQHRLRRAAARPRAQSGRRQSDGRNAR